MNEHPVLVSDVNLYHGLIYEYLAYTH